MVNGVSRGSPAAKTLEACGPSAFGLGTSLGTLFTTLPSQLFQIMSHCAACVVQSIVHSQSLPGRGQTVPLSSEGHTEDRPLVTLQHCLGEGRGVHHLHRKDVAARDGSREIMSVRSSPTLRATLALLAASSSPDTARHVKSRWLESSWSSWWHHVGYYLVIMRS